MRHFALIVLGLFFIGLVVFGYLMPFPFDEQAQEVGEQSYRNDVYEYTVTVPEGLDIKEYLPENVVFGHIDGEMVAGVVELRAMTIRGQAGETFLDATTHDLANLCAADGPNASISCTGIESSEEFRTGGLVGTELYLKAELKEFPSGQVTGFTMGPYFVFQRQSSAAGSSILVIHAPLNQNADEADIDTIRAVAESLIIE
jgi:hypothetical protein